MKDLEVQPGPRMYVTGAPTSDVLPGADIGEDTNDSSPLRGIGSPTRWVGASRGDRLTRHLFKALERRYAMVGLIDTELRAWQRYLIAAGTFHPSRELWRERFWKSRHAFHLRSANSRSALTCIGRANPYDIVIQVHALFQTRGAPYIAYIDNTHHQSVEGWPRWNPFSGPDLACWYEYEWRTYEQAVHLFCMGEPAAASLVNFYGIPRERVTNVGAGANIEAMPPPREALREPVILFIGHDLYRKGGDHLLAGFRRVRERMPAARLRIVGTSEPAAEPGVEVLGRIDDRRQIERIYAQAGVFCLPSRFDPYPLVMMEAMAHGLPCVGTTVGGVPEIVVQAETGLLVPPEDTSALSEALLYLLENPNYAARFGAAGRRRVQTYLNWDSVVARMSPVLDRLAEAEGVQTIGVERVGVAAAQNTGCRGCT